MLATEHALDLSQGNTFLQGLNGSGHFMLYLGIILLGGQIQEHLHLRQLFPLALPVLDDILELPMLFLHLLGDIGIVPEIRGQGLLFKPFELIFFVI
jgi:hypothetical protein